MLNHLRLRLQFVGHTAQTLLVILCSQAVKHFFVMSGAQSRIKLALSLQVYIKQPKDKGKMSYGGPAGPNAQSRAPFVTKKSGRSTDPTRLQTHGGRPQSSGRCRREPRGALAGDSGKTPPPTDGPWLCNTGIPYFATSGVTTNRSSVFGIAQFADPCRQLQTDLQAAGLHPNLQLRRFLARWCAVSRTGCCVS